MPGFSQAGAGQWIEERTHEGELSSAPHLKNRSIFEWPDKVPRFYSTRTFWAESACKGLAAAGRSDLLGSFNYTFLYLICLAYYPRYGGRIWASMKTLHEELRPKKTWLLLYHINGINRATASLLWKRLYQRKLRLGNKALVEVIDGIDCSKAAMLALREFTRKLDMKIQWPSN
jgi:hypothetical protein